MGGLCDKVEACNTEWDVIRELEALGYVLLHFSNWNTQLARKQALEGNRRVAQWAARTFSCTNCWVYNEYPYASHGRLKYCRWCARSKSPFKAAPLIRTGSSGEA